MTDLFASAKSLLRRADHHIADMETTIKAGTPINPYTYVIEQDSKTGDYVHKIKFPTGFSDDVSCIMFDAVNNLRASLDQMTYAIAFKHRGRAGDFAPFPFAKDIAHWPNKIKGLQNDIPLEIRTLFERFKPYKGGNDTLWALNYVANVLVPIWHGGARITIPAGSGVTPTSVTPADRAEKDEIEIYRSSDPPNRHPNIQIAYSVIIDHSEKVIQGQQPIALLNAMHREVGCVLTDTEAECRRIRLF